MNELISAGAAKTTEARSPCMPAATITGLPGGGPSTLESVTDIWRREPESNRRRRICNPLHDHSAIAPINSGFAGRKCIEAQQGVTERFSKKQRVAIFDDI